MTTALDIATVVPTEEIEAMILGAHRSTPTAIDVAWSKPVGKGSGNNVQIPRRVGVTTNPGTKVELANFALVNSTTAAENVSGGWVGHADEVSWESNNHSVIQAVQLVITDGVEAIVDRVDTDGLAIAAAAANSSSFTLAALTDNNVIVAQAAYNAQRPHSGSRAIVLYTNQQRDWATDLNTNGGNQLGGDLESERVAKLLGFGDGFIGMRHNLAIFVSENVPIAAGDATGFIAKMGLGGPLAYRNWAPIGAEFEWIMLKKGWDVVVAANYGWVISDELNIRSVVSRSA